MNAFASYHPSVNLIYFIAVIGFTCFFMHPLCLIISFLSAGVYLLLLQKERKLWAYLLPMMVLTALLNPLFNHQGVTVLGYLPDGNPLTMESVLYGVSAAGMIAGVVCWFSCYNTVMTSDKFICLFGRILPSLSLVFSMILRFVPRLITQFKAVSDAQRGLGRHWNQGSPMSRAKNGLKVLSIVTAWAFENAIDTADSMKARGYGLKGRTSFSLYTFGRRDAIALSWIVLLSGHVLVGALSGAVHFSYFPVLSGSADSAYTYSVFVAYLALGLYPMMLELKEGRKWSAIKSKT